MKTKLLSPLMALSMIPVLVLAVVAPAAADDAPGISAIYDFGTTPIGAFYCLPDADVLSKIPVLGDFSDAIQGDQHSVGVNIRGIDRNAAYRNVEGYYSVTVQGGNPRLGQPFTGTLDSAGGFAKATQFRMGSTETYARADLTGSRFSPDKGKISFRNLPSASAESIVTVNCLLSRDIDDLDSLQEDRLVDALANFFSAVLGRRLRRI